MRAFARVSAERLSSYVGRGLSFRGPGLGPGLRFNPSGPCAFHALSQQLSCLTYGVQSRTVTVMAGNRIVGRCGSIRSHCSSLGRNRFLRTIPAPFKPEPGSYCQR